MEKRLEQFMAQAREDMKAGNARLDHYTPTKLKLAIHEVDDKNVSAFSFRSKGDILKVCRVVRW